MSILDGWEVTDDAQVIPVSDSRKHILSEKCWCKPTMTENGVLIHNSTDKRENYETKQ